MAGCAERPPATEPGQRAAPDFELPETSAPAFPPGEGPRVVIDEAHQNYHTAGGRYAAFAALLERDGYRVGGLSAQLSAEVLAGIDMLVISNAIHPDNAEAWTLPNPSAFTPAEIAAVEQWVQGGGQLMLIADHMPMPGAAADLARAFGVLFHDGFAYDADGVGRMTFRRDDGSLADHPVTATGPIEFVTTFTGQAFRILDDVDFDPLMRVPAGSYILLPEEAWEFSDATPRIPADGMLQGALIRHGEGRVAVFGEAAEFSAQIQEQEDGTVVRMGMNHPDAPHNAQFLLNVLHWLSDAE
jgi:hypothetical protein